MSSPIKTYRDLVVWQKAMSLVTEVYEVSRRFPKEELYGITSQLRRAAVSIPSNIAEGHARRSRSEYARLVQIAIGSLNELQTQLEITVNLKYLSKTDFERLEDRFREIDRMLSSLFEKLSLPQIPPHRK